MSFNYTPTPFAIVFELLNKARDRKGLALFRIDRSKFILTWSNGTKPISISELEDLTPKSSPSLFEGGYVGWLGFEAGFQFEGISPLHPPPQEPLDLFWACDGAIHIDVDKQETIVRGTDAFKTEAHDTMHNPFRSSVGPQEIAPLGHPHNEEAYFTSAVEKIQSEIREGLVYQVNMSWNQKYSIQDSLSIFERLFISNPAQFASYLQFDNAGVISNSPELFLSVEPKENTTLITSIPIKGTANQTDFQSRLKLWHSPKERSELSMIVDMVRNDIGRIAEPGSVKVHHRRIRRCGDLLHAEQKVTAALRANCRIVELIAATFPPASVTGAPKVSAIKRIHRLEKMARGIYTGCIGYIGYGGHAQFSVAIRCLPFIDQTARLHIGSGIVHDSSPSLEWLETLAKARAIQNILSPPRSS